MTKPIWPKIPARFVSSMLAGHSALGLAFAGFIYILCLTGTILVLAHEISRWENPSVTPMPDVSTPSLTRALEKGFALAEEMGTNDYVIVTTPSDGEAGLVLRAVDFENGHEKLWNVDATGEILSVHRDEFSHFLEHLHFYLLLPEFFGLIIVGLIGVSLLSSVVSGTLSHPRIFKDAFRFRRGGSKRLEEADLHNRLSVWGLPFHIIVPLTGAILGLSTLVLGVLAAAAFDGDLGKARSIIGGPTVERNESPQPVPDLNRIAEDVLRQYQGSTIARFGVREFGTRGQTVQIDLSMPHDLTITERVIYNGDGALVGTRNFADGPLGAQLIASLGPLHFGWFGEGLTGWVVKISYVMLGLALTFITSSGVAIWIARRRDKGKPVPGWEKIWLGVVWGQPVLYALIAALTITGPPISLEMVWLAGTLATIVLPLFSRTARSVSQIYRALLGIALLVLIPLNITVLGVPSDGMATAIHVTLIMTALFLLGTLFTWFSHARNAAPAE